MIIGQVMGTFGGGGAERSALNLAVGLAELGHESRLVALRAPGDFAAPWVGRLPVDAIGFERGPRAFTAVARLCAVLRRRRFDVIHVHGSGSLPVVAAAMVVASGCRPSLCFTWHDSGAVLGGGRARRLAIRWALGRCTSVFGSSRDVARRLEAAWGRGVAGVCSNGVPDPGLPVPAIGDRPTVVWAARLVPEKRPEWFVRLAATARDAGLAARFVLAGTSPPSGRAFEASVRALSAGLGDPVEFVGWVDRPHVLLSEGGIGVQTSATEGLSMTLLEQMMAGQAIVATDVGDTAIALAGGEAGVLVPPDDEATLKGAVLGLLRDPSLRRRLATAARRRALAEYTCRRMAERCLESYRVGCR